MNYPSLTATAAVDLQNQYQSLIGTLHYKENSDWVIESITAAPYEEVAKLLFIYSYEELKDTSKALSYYPYDIYDVIVVFRSLSTNKVFYAGLREYLAIING